MSYKDGIPLLTTFEDEVDDPDDYMLRSVVPKKFCRRRNILLGIVLSLAFVLVVGVAVSVSLGVTLKPGGRPSEGGHGTSETSGSGEGEESSNIIMSMTMPPLPSVDISPLPDTAVETYTFTTATPTSSVLVAPSASEGGSSIVPSGMSSATPTSSSSSTSNPPTMPTPSSTTTAPSTPAPSSKSSIVVLTSASIAVNDTASQAPPTMSPNPSPSPSPLPPTEPPCSNDTQICPSLMDSRMYEFKVLENGLRVVLISDPLTDQEGASVNVAAGSFNDPSNLTGLAHFCEHMLFLGTDKYPEKNMYSNFISTHGGYDNAYTSTQETNYHFRVNAGSLRQPLDMLANFFISPLFTRNSTYSEMFAVSQEHEKNLHSDPWKLWQLLKQVSNPDHPFSQFSTGNFETLNKTGVNDDLQSYYDENYIAKNVSFGNSDKEPRIMDTSQLALAHCNTEWCPLLEGFAVLYVYIGVPI